MYRNKNLDNNDHSFSRYLKNKKYTHCIPVGNINIFKSGMETIAKAIYNNTKCTYIVFTADQN